MPEAGLGCALLASKGLPLRNWGDFATMFSGFNIAKPDNTRRICTGVSILIAALSAVVEITGLEPVASSPPD